ncbi:MAG: hypothetical protein LBS50_08745 [Prevotellaceae bacterium]|jgi:integrase|nr:hypothetical protein [Prevotellaceae bacterium]
MQGYHLQNADYYLFRKKSVTENKPFGMNHFNRLFADVRRELGINPQCKFYSFKHTGIITALQNGMHPFDVMNHCRHKSFDTTERYIKKRTKIAKDNSQFFGTI